MGRLLMLGQYKNKAIQSKEKITHLTFNAKGFPNRPPAIYLIKRFNNALRIILNITKHILL